MAKFFVFPFAASGTTSPVPDPSQMSGSVSYQSGYTLNYTLDPLSSPAAIEIGRAQFNQILNDITGALQQYQTHSIADFITTSDNDGSPYAYDIYAYVRFDPGTGIRIYQNSVQGNTTTPIDPSWIDVTEGKRYVGEEINFYGTTLQTNCLASDGSAVSRATYATLFSVIGTTWGVGDGSTTFNLPDTRRRVAMGVGGTGTTIIANTTGSKGGEEGHTQLLSELVGHGHAVTPSAQIYLEGGSGNQASAPDDAKASNPISFTAQNTGGGNPFNIIQPSYIVSKQIVYQ